MVTYETVLEFDNSELLLRPGMTATAEIVTTNIQDAVLVPNAALRFTPEGESIPGAPNAQPQRGALSAIMPQMPRRMGGNQQQGNAARRTGRAWILENGKPVLVMFRPGATDGRFTQVLPIEDPATILDRMKNASQEVIESTKKALERKLEPGMQVIVDAVASKKS